MALTSTTSECALRIPFFSGKIQHIESITLIIGLCVQAVKIIPLPSILKCQVPRKTVKCVWMVNNSGIPGKERDPIESLSPLFFWNFPWKTKSFYQQVGSFHQPIFRNGSGRYDRLIWQRAGVEHSVAPHPLFLLAAEISIDIVGVRGFLLGM